MGVQPTNIPQIDFRNPNSSMSQPGMPGGSSWYPNQAREARTLARFGQGSNPNGANYNKFLDVNNKENWRGAGQPGTRGGWYGAPWARGGSIPQSSYQGSGKWALGGQGSYGNTVQMDPNSNYPDNTSRIRNSNPLYNMPQTQTRPTDAYVPPDWADPLRGNLDPNRPHTKPMYNQQYMDGSYVPGTERPRPY